jgi:RHS repeat-associated protein
LLVQDNMSFYDKNMICEAAETYRYTAFGEELTDGKLSPWRFASKRIEDETGLIFFGRRYYSPALGKWISPVPQGYDNGPNLYAYLSNSPLTDYDLYGLWSMREAWGSAQHFMWGMLEGSAYHFSNMASSFCMRDFSNTGWQPRSLLTNQDLAIPRCGLDRAEKAFLPFTYEARRLGSDVSQYDQMRARGRALGEQAITFGGLFSAFSAGRSLLNTGTRFQEAARFPAQESSREYLFSGKPTITESSQSLKGARNRFKPDIRAEGAHSVFRRDPVTGQVSHYETFRPQTNPYDPKPWKSVLRFDAFGEEHLNKALKQWISTPHVHDPYYPGGIRPAWPRELPK